MTVAQPVMGRGQEGGAKYFELLNEKYSKSKNLYLSKYIYICLQKNIEKRNETLLKAYGIGY